MYIFLTCYKGQEVVRRLHMLPHRSQFSYCLFASGRNRLLHRRLFSRHKQTRICPSHIRILSWICIWTFTFQSSERDVRSKNHNDLNLCWIYCFHAWLRHGAYMASTPRISLFCRTLCRCAIHSGRRNLCRSLFERCSSGIGHHGAHDSESSIFNLIAP